MPAKKIRLGWTNRSGKINPAKRYRDLLEAYGEPHFLLRGDGGMAIWTKDQVGSKCFERIILKDERILHTNPKKHYDFLYTVVKVSIPQDKLMDILGLSQSIMYDQLKKELIVRCHFEKANKATILLVLKILHGELTLEEIKKDGLYKKYIMDPEEDIEKKYEKEICKYLKK